jgi:hypothetical protein
VSAGAGMPRILVAPRAAGQGRFALPPDGVLLFSAEDLENCLVDADFGRQFMLRARAKGATSVRCVFVQRNEFERNYVATFLRPGIRRRFDRELGSVPPTAAVASS